MSERKIGTSCALHTWYFLLAASYLLEPVRGELQGRRVGAIQKKEKRRWAKRSRSRDEAVLKMGSMG